MSFSCVCVSREGVKSLTSNSPSSTYGLILLFHPACLIFWKRGSAEATQELPESLSAHWEVPQGGNINRSKTVDDMVVQTAQFYQDERPLLTCSQEIAPNQKLVPFHSAQNDLSSSVYCSSLI